MYLLKCKLSASQVPVRRGGALLKSWVFKSFLKVERDTPALVVLGSSFHQRGTTNENSGVPYLHRRQCQTTLTRRAQHPRCNICPYTTIYVCGSRTSKDPGGHEKSDRRRR